MAERLAQESRESVRECRAAIERQLSGSLSQSFQVCEILQPARSPLILSQSFAPQERYLEILNDHDPARPPRIGELHPSQVSQEVDPSGRKSSFNWKGPSLPRVP